MTTAHYDIIIAGAGPAGLSFCRAMSNSGLTLGIVDIHNRDTLANPPFDGREIALTHPSKHTLEALEIWSRLPADEIYNLREASVINGNSSYQLHFPLPATNTCNQPIETLGYLVSNHRIRQAAYEACQTQDNLTWHTGQRITNAYSDTAAAHLCLDNGDTLSAPLLIAADSRLSFVRRCMGIPTDMHDFGRTVMVFRLAHTIDNDHTAFECFFYGSTLALLPLTDKLINCVITIDSRHVNELKAMDGEALAAYVAHKVNHRFGQMTLASTIHDYPLLGVHAQRFYAPRCALIGDAACGMHPVTAHGFNLGLQSQAILSRHLLRQAGQGKDIGATEILRRYSREHSRNTRILYHGTNAIVKLFTHETRPARFVRDKVLRISNYLPPLKTLITRQLTG